MMKLMKFSLNTGKEGLYSITANVREALIASGAESGICVVYTPHTTAGITINENADPCVGDDILKGLSRAYPELAGFTHFEGNSSAHLKALAAGMSQTVIIENSSLVLGRWQGIYFCEFDGPRNREYCVKIIKD